ILAPGFVSFVTDELVTRFGPSVTYGGGLRVVTTLDWAMTQEAQQLIQAQVRRYGWGNVHQGAMVAIDPHSGAVLAMVGSADPNANGGQYNFAVWPPRNPGSSMKIYTYTAAIASGSFTMVSPVHDQPISVPQGPGQPLYTPRNYDGRLHGTCQLQACFLNSLNIPAVRVELALANGPADVAQMARTMGAPPWHCQDPPACQHFTDNDPLSSYGASLTLGGWGETPLQMATGASVLAAQGVLHQPTSLASITTADGHPFYKLDASSGAKQVIDPRVAYIVEQMMSDDSNRAMIFGRGSSLTLPDHKVGSKTGTTDDYRDGWTVGYTPAVATAFWFGNADFSPMNPYLESTVIAAPIWHAFMEWTLNVDLKRPGNEWFAQPAGLLQYTVAGKVQWFLPGTSPYQSTPQPQGVVVRRKTA
ncbi:MAG: transglycosylase domain-containing protein, partial [Candidatus Dormiibacterota bacterium]